MALSPLTPLPFGAPQYPSEEDLEQTPSHVCQTFLRCHVFDGCLYEHDKRKCLLCCTSTRTQRYSNEKTNTTMHPVNSISINQERLQFFYSSQTNTSDLLRSPNRFLPILPSTNVFGFDVKRSQYSASFCEFTFQFGSWPMSPICYLVP